MHWITHYEKRSLYNGKETIKGGDSNKIKQLVGKKEEVVRQGIYAKRANSKRIAQLHLRR